MRNDPFHPAERSLSGRKSSLKPGSAKSQPQMQAQTAPAHAPARPLAKTQIRTSSRSVESAVLSLLSSPALHAVVLVTLGLLLLFGSTTLSIAAIWERSETFAHGFIVVPMCLWLAWRQREGLAGLTAKPWWPGIAIVFLSGALWLMGRAASALVVQQFALAFMIQAAIVTVLGTRLAAALLFPIAFLLFAVPAGEAFVPTLIEWTADFTIAALRWSGVPVYREANHFIIPSGAWSVVEACSGIRYIIASAMVGTVYAAIGFRSWRRRGMVLAASLLIPIVANWMRAYLIVMIGHLSSNRLAVGVDHLIFGWVFFGLVMLLFFWIASRWQEPADDPVPVAPSLGAGAERSGGRRAIPIYSTALSALVAAAVWLPIDHALSRPVNSELAQLRPMSGQKGWSSTDSPVTQWKPRYGGFVSEVQQTFEKGDRKVGVYLAYFHGQAKGRELVTSSNVLVTMEDWNWRQISRGDGTIEWTGNTAPIRRYEIVGAETRLNVYRLYWIDGELTASDYIAKLLTSWSKLRGHGDDSALILLFTPEGPGGARNDEVLRAFAADMSASIQQSLASARSEAP